MKSEWLNLVDAVRALRDARQVSDVVAIALLCQACESRVIQSRQRPWPDDEDEVSPNCWISIPPLKWRGATIDLEHDWLVLASGWPMKAVVQLNAANLRPLLDVEEPKPKEVQPTPVVRKRGPKPDKLEATKKRMRDDLAAGRFIEMQLQDMNEEALSKEYGVSRDTARKARNAVLSEFGR